MRVKYVPLKDLGILFQDGDEYREFVEGCWNKPENPSWKNYTLKKLGGDFTLWRRPVKKRKIG